MLPPPLESWFSLQHSLRRPTVRPSVRPTASSIAPVRSFVRSLDNGGLAVGRSRKRCCHNRGRGSGASELLAPAGWPVDRCMLATTTGLATASRRRRRRRHSAYQRAGDSDDDGRVHVRTDGRTASERVTAATNGNSSKFCCRWLNSASSGRIIVKDTRLYIRRLSENSKKKLHSR